MNNNWKNNNNSILRGKVWCINACINDHIIIVTAIKFQENLLKTMIQIENSFFELGRSCQRNCLIICDRGAMDASACKCSHIIITYFFRPCDVWGNPCHKCVHFYMWYLISHKYLRWNQAQVKNVNKTKLDITNVKLALIVILV